jgi:hypothetical protein
MGAAVSAATAIPRPRATGIDWPRARVLTGRCPECHDERPCVNVGRECDGDEIALAGTAEIGCANCPGFASGFCAACGRALCDECGPERGAHGSWCAR